MRNKDMEYAKRDYDHEEEAKGLYVILGNVGTE